MTKPRTILIDGNLYQWRDIIELRRTQLDAHRKAQEQSALFDLIEDQRPKSQRTASGRYNEPLLFD